MNKAAEIVSKSIINEEHVNIVVQGKIYCVKPLTIKKICKVLFHFSHITIDQNYTKISILSEIPNNKKAIISGLAVSITDNIFKRIMLKRRLYNSTNKEIDDIWNEIIPMFGGDDFFGYALSMRSATEMIAKPKL